MNNEYVFSINDINIELINRIDINPTLIINKKETLLYSPNLALSYCTCFIGNYINTAAVNDLIFTNNKQKTILEIINICLKTKQNSLEIDDERLINDQIIEAICQNPNIKIVKLYGKTNVYSLSNKYYQMLKKSHKEKIFTYGVSDELRTNFDPIIDYNQSKKLIGEYNYQKLINASNLTFDQISENEVDYLKFINTNIDLLTIYLNDKNYYLIPKILQATKNIKKKKIIIENVKEKKKIIDFLKTMNKYISFKQLYLADFFNLINAEDFLNGEKMLSELIRPAINLTPLEKFMYAYNVVKQFKIYNTCENKSEANDIYRILNNNYINCAGYASLLNELLFRLGIESTIEVINVDTGLDSVDINAKILPDNVLTNPEGHVRVLVKIVDSDYKVNGYYFSDPTWDNDSENYLYYRFENDLYNHSLMTGKEVVCSSRYVYFNRNSILELFYSENIDDFRFRLDYYIKNNNKSYYQIVLLLLVILEKIDNELYTKIMQKYFSCLDKNLDEIMFNKIMDYIGLNIISRLNNQIDGQTIRKVILKLYKDVYKFDKWEEKVDKTMKTNASYQSLFFPSRKVEKEDENFDLDAEKNKFKL